LLVLDEVGEKTETVRRWSATLVFVHWNYSIVQNCTNVLLRLGGVGGRVALDNLQRREIQNEKIEIRTLAREGGKFKCSPRSTV